MKHRLIPTAESIAYRMCIRAMMCYLILAASSVRAIDPLYRTDGGNDKLPWFQLKAGEFPPEGSAHAISGELIAVDHVNRTGTIRLDRDDTQRRGDWDRPLPFTMLPFSSIFFHGALAELRDIPIGTHLHGLFYIEPSVGKGAFNRAFRLEDDFSFSARDERTWRIDAIALDTGGLTVTTVDSAPSDTKPKTFQLAATTRVWMGHVIGALTDLAVGQKILMNLTACTLHGPGRCTDIWIDSESRQIAIAHQLEVHRQYQREHGLAGWVSEVDNQEGIVTVILFAGFDPKLMEDFAKEDVITAAVAEESLRTWDQINDRKAGPLLALSTVANAPGSSGYLVKFKPSLLLEGFRPKKIVRLFCSKWKVDDLPKEERLYQ